MVERRASSRSKSESLAAGNRAVIALLNPAARNTGSHISTPLINHGTHFAGVAGAMYQTVGFIGSETAPGGALCAHREGSVEKRGWPGPRAPLEFFKDRAKKATRSAAIPA